MEPGTPTMFQKCKLYLWPKEVLSGILLEGAMYDGPMSRASDHSKVN